MPTKAKSQELAYSQALNQNKSIGRGKETQDPESQAHSYGGWCLELRWEGRYGEEDPSG